MIKMAACSTRSRRFSDVSSGLNDSEQKSQRSQCKLTRKVTQEANDGQKKCAGLKSKKGAKGGGKKIEEGVGDKIGEGFVEGIDGGIDERVGEVIDGGLGESVKDWVEEVLRGLVRGSAGRKALKLLRASVTVRWRRAKWYAVTFARVGPISDVWG